MGKHGLRGNKMKCIECEKTVTELHPDHRIPPVCTDNCLCADCHDDAVMDALLEVEERAEELKGSLINS